MKRLPASAAIAVVLATLVLSACGSSSTPPPSTTLPSSASSATGVGQAAATYVAGFCKAFNDYLKKAPTPSLGSGSDLQKLKRFYVSFFAGEISAIHDLVTKIEALGSPAVPRGAQVAKSMIKALTALESETRSLREVAASLPTSSRTAFNKAVNRLFAQFKESTGTALGNPFRGNPELLAALKSSPECAMSASSPTGASPSSPVSISG